MWLRSLEVNVTTVILSITIKYWYILAKKLQIKILNIEDVKGEWVSMDERCWSEVDEHNDVGPTLMNKHVARRSMSKSCCSEVNGQKLLPGGQWAEDAARRSMNKSCYPEVHEQIYVARKSMNIRCWFGGRWTNDVDRRTMNKKIIWSEVNEQTMLLGHQWKKWCWLNIDNRKLTIFIGESYNQTICILW